MAEKQEPTKYESSKPTFPMPPNPGEVDQRPTWLKFLDNPLGESIKAINKVEDKVAKKMSKKNKKNDAQNDDETVATSMRDEDDDEKKQPLLEASLS
ncbi:unnamed protein product [Cylindrotheca closterium]|uniref:Uncharacterized protein n=1 Tax=Cylindrotheca closterium TaxID=2856 RepID=A0AAD2JN92_9STRA|nr:unnamed protein product [Cylindrotheca closterium]